ncbi:hypothetical protein BGZ49_000780, partial [Haplosporangium sp. Z 27]
PKFGAKVRYIKNLSQLAESVPLYQIKIPAAVYQHNLKFESSIVLPDNQKNNDNKVFGVALEKLMGENGEKGLPTFIQECISNITENGLYVEGLFRRSPSSAMLKQVRTAYDNGSPINLAEYDIHISAVLLKLFLRELPEPIFPVSVYEKLQKQHEDEKGITVGEFIKSDVIPHLSHNNLILTMEVFRLLRMVADRHESNKMTALNLAIVLSPNLVRHSDVMQEIAMSSVGSKDKDSALDKSLTLGTVVRIMIENYDDIF